MDYKKKWIKIGNLEWLNEDLGEHNWQDAHSICKENGGRLPTKAELVGLFDNHFKEMAKMLGDDADNYFWSSDTYSYATRYGWYVNPHNGYTLYTNKTVAYKVRCCRDAVLSLSSKREMVVDNTGNVGIGTTGPRNYFLEIDSLKEQLTNRNKTVFVGWIVIIFLIIMFIIK